MDGISYNNSNVYKYFTATNRLTTVVGHCIQVLFQYSPFYIIILTPNFTVLISIYIVSVGMISDMMFKL